MIIKLASGQFDCFLEWRKFNNGNNNIAIREKATGKCLALIGSDVDEMLLDNEIAVYDFKYNRGVVNSLFINGVLTSPMGWIATRPDGRTEGAVPICQILKKKLY